MSTTSTYFKEGPLPSLSKDEEDTLDLVIYDVEIAAEEYNVDELERSIRQVWEVALRIGVKHGQREARQAHTNTTKELEQERVWGFDVGWKLCSEQLQSCAPQASLDRSSSPSLRSLSVAATQTDAVAATPVVVASPAPVHLDWAQDAEALQVSPRKPEFLPFPPRDFSALSTGTPQPFASLQRRRRRPPRVPSSVEKWSQSHSISTRRKKSSVHHSAPQHRSRFPSFISPPSTSFTSGRREVSPPLNWDQDPRLRDLGQALAALGWARL
ncbi:hypothetical protein B0H17DRAFT_1209354 [Mycena rosella]|uniref:Uncharacterized protein n=1 Tax=Mycena rosella TaxID=1033263 RepID=A0AAD7CYJ0_MYCRO|nr:hypothetical protein B0H17DRAFT_1209354 [Mycena rosella]